MGQKAIERAIRDADLAELKAEDDVDAIRKGIADALEKELDLNTQKESDDANEARKEKQRKAAQELRDGQKASTGAKGDPKLSRQGRTPKDGR